jgi:hypothetical protein
MKKTAGLLRTLGHARCSRPIYDAFFRWRKKAGGAR